MRSLAAAKMENHPWVMLKGTEDHGRSPPYPSCGFPLVLPAGGSRQGAPWLGLARKSVTAEPSPSSRSTAQSGDAAPYTRHRDSHSPMVSPDIVTSALNETQGSRSDNKSPCPLEGILSSCLSSPGTPGPVSLPRGHVE